MRFLHTSDIHLGQRFHRRDRQREHSEYLAWLRDRFVETEADAVLIAGDVFDVASPPSYAREQLAGFVHDIRQAGGQLIILGGNHDSPLTLSENLKPWSLLSALVIPSVAPEDAAANVHVISKRDGTPGMVLCAVPFIHERQIVRSVAGQSDEERRAMLANAIAQYYREIYDAALEKRQMMGLDLPIVATGHLTLVGASLSESVKEIYVGSLEALSTEMLPPADYVALGHIHRGMKVGGHDHIRYCGSPIALSFDELNRDKEVLVVHFGAGRSRQIEALGVPRFQAMGRISAPIDELPEALDVYLAENPADAERPTWLEVAITDAGYLPDLGERVGQLVEGRPVEVLRITSSRRGDASAGIESSPESLDELTPEQVFQSLLDKRGAGVPPDRLPRVRELFASVANDVQERMAS